MRRLARSLSLGCVVLAWSVVAGFAMEADRVETGDPPSWTEGLENPDLVQVDLDQVKGSAYLVVHRQWIVEGDRLETTVHIAQKVVDTAGLQDLTRIEVDVDPSYESLTFHFIRVRRHGQLLDRLDPSRIELLQREDDLERRIYDETQSAVVFLDDVRVGDVVEYAYTVRGSNPVFDGHFSQDLPMAFAVPVGSLRFRIVIRDDRELQIRGHRFDGQPARHRTAEGREFVWHLRNVQAVVDEDSVPLWYDQYPWVQVTDFRDWGEVVRWALPLYRPPLSSGGGIDEIVAGCEQMGAAEDKALCAIRFVQDEIRYLGLEIGPSSHRPHHPVEVLANRYGDCKDKSLLLVMILGRLGFKAAPALVNTDIGRGIEEWLPTSDAFDHVIVRVDSDGGIVYVDATHSLQGGSFETMVQPSFGRALVIAEGVADLEKMPEPSDVGRFETEEAYVVRNDGGADLTVTTTWTGSEADWQRSDLAQLSIAELTSDSLNYYDGDFPGIEPKGELAVSDDRRANRLTIVETYSAPEFWESGRRTLSGAAIVERGPEEPMVRIRKHPLGVEHPLDIRHSIEVELPFRPRMVADKQVIESGVFRFASWLRAVENTVVADYTMTTSADSVEAAEVKDYLSSLDRVHRSLRFTVFEQSSAAGGRILDGSALRWFVYAGATCLLVVSFWVAIRRGRMMVRK